MLPTCRSPSDRPPLSCVCQDLPCSGMLCPVMLKLVSGVPSGTSSPESSVSSAGEEEVGGMLMGSACASLG